MSNADFQSRLAWIPGPARPVLRWALTFHIVCLAWIFFRAESLDKAWSVLTGIATTGGDSPLVTPLIVAVIAGSLATQFFPKRFTLELQGIYARFAPAAQAAAFGLGLLFVDALGPEGVAPFIYFQF